MVLLQTSHRLSSSTFRRHSTSFSDDTFTFSPNSSSHHHLLSQTKLLLRRLTAASSSLDSNHPSESIRQFTKILDSRRTVPAPFSARCFVARASAFRSASRIADSLADLNRALAIDPTSIPALRARADLLQSIRSFPDCLRDLNHLKLLYDSIIRDRKLPGPPWRAHYEVRYRNIPGCIRQLTTRIQQLRERISSGELFSVDYYLLIGVRRGCTRSELERAHLLLTLWHKPDKAAGFVDRIEFADENRDMDAVRDQAKMSALILYRMLEKGYSSIMVAVMDEEAAEKRRLKEAAAATVMQGVFCRDLAAVGSLLKQVGFSRQHIPVKYEGLSC